MYLRHFALTRLPFETPAHTDELFDSNSRREAETRLNHLIELRGIGLLTERAHEVSGTSKRGRLGKNHRVPTRHHRAASGPVPPVLRLADHRQRARHVLGRVNTNEHGHAILFGWNSPKLNTNASRHTSRSNAAM